MCNSPKKNGGKLTIEDKKVKKIDKMADCKEVTRRKSEQIAKKRRQSKARKMFEKHLKSDRISFIIKHTRGETEQIKEHKTVNLSTWRVFCEEVRNRALRKGHASRPELV